MYGMAHKWGIQPSEFWAMTVPEWFLLFDINRPQMQGDFAGNLTQGDVDRLSALLDED